jgi:hypothetical protein
VQVEQAQVVVLIRQALERKALTAEIQTLQDLLLMEVVEVFAQLTQVMNKQLPEVLVEAVVAVVAVAVMAQVAQVVKVAQVELTAQMVHQVRRLLDLQVLIKVEQAEALAV